MEYNKTEILNTCRELLQLIRCEVVVDITERQLFNVLFQSEVKKKVLLTWLIQQIYSSEACSNFSIEDLVTIFIPSAQYKTFINGSMPVPEQFRKWKLIMSTLYKQQKRKSFGESVNYEKELLQGVLMDKYENMWNGKLEFSQNFNYSLIELPKKLNNNELESKLQQARSILQEVKNNNATETEVSILDSEEFLSALNSYKHSSEKLNKTISKECLPVLNYFKEHFDFLHYQNLDSDLLRNIKANIDVLNENIATMNEVLRGVENVSNEVEAGS